MSTYYYMACKSCMEVTDEIIAITRISGSHLDHEEHLLAFMLEHLGCNLEFVSEHADLVFEECKKWKQSQTKETP